MVTPSTRTEKILSDAFSYTFNTEGRKLLRSKLDTLVKRRVLQSKLLDSISTEINMVRLDEPQKIQILNLISNSEFGNVIEDVLIKNFRSGLNPKVFDDGLKTLYTFTALFKSSEQTNNLPQCDKNSLFSTVVAWAFEPNGSNHLELESLSYAIRFDVDVKSILKINSNIPPERESFKQLVDIYREREKFKERNSFTVQGISAVAMLGVLSLGALGDVEVNSSIVEPIQQTLGSFMGDELNIKSLFTIVVTTYLGTKFISKGTDWTTKIYSSFCNSLNITQLGRSFKDRVSHRLICSQLYQGYGYNVDALENRKSIFCSAFLAEKMQNKDLTISDAMVSSFNAFLSKDEITRLNEIKQDEIVELSNLKSPYFVSLFLENKFSDRAKNILKNIDSWSFITNKGIYGDKKYYYQGTFFNDYTQITTISDFTNHPFVKKILELDNVLDQYNGVTDVISRLNNSSIGTKERANLLHVLDMSNASAQKIASTTFLQDKKVSYESLFEMKTLVNEFIIAYTSGTKTLTKDTLDSLDRIIISDNYLDQLSSLVIKSVKGSVQKTKQIKTWGILSKISAVAKASDSYNNVNPIVRDFIKEASIATSFDSAVNICNLKGSGISSPIYKISDTLFKIRSKNKLS